MADAFDTADFYDCDPEADRLGYKTVADAIDGASADISGDGSVTVYAWARKTLPQGFCLRAAGYLLDSFNDHLVDDEFASPDDGADFSKSDEAVAIEKIAVALEELVATKPIWACERVAERAFTYAELRDLIAADKVGGDV